ncbi:MAG TPA: YciI-like protein [Mycobacteriales bacterium]|nr:YciI-like protein [Mycobacteriales bacterium]
MLALIYDLAEDYLERRGPLRAEHLGLAEAARLRGDLLLAGAFSDPFDHALLVWATDDQAVVEDFVEADPYVRDGLVTGWTVRHWNVVVGAPPQG